MNGLHVFKANIFQWLCQRTTSRSLIVAAVLLGAGSPALTGPLQIHPRSEPLPTTYQGPFVTTQDGGILCIDAAQAHHSTDEGKTWTSTPLFKNPAQFKVSDERVLFRTREGVVISAWMNGRERKTPNGPAGRIWGGTPAEFAEWILPTYVCRSLDDGKTWEEPRQLQKAWCGCIHSIVQMKSGRIVLVGQTIIPEWRHATVVYVSDDLGKTWQASDLLDYGVGKHDHAGTCEATVLERADGSLYLLLRNESGRFYEAESTDGLRWTHFRKSSIPTVTCCGNMYRLADGRAVLLWNAPIRNNPRDEHSRYELSLAFSHDDGKTWTPPTVIAARYPRSGDKSYENRASYPYLYERRPGELWVTTMQGSVRLKIAADQITAGEVPVPRSILFLGDSTTARRPGEVTFVAAERVAAALESSRPGTLVLNAEVAKASSNVNPATGFSGRVLNSGVPSSTTADGVVRLRADLPASNAAIVVVQFGINDAAVDVWKTPPAAGSRVPLADYEANLTKIVGMARKAGASVIFATTNPVRWTPKLKGLYGKVPYDVDAEDGFDRPILSKYNAAVRKVATDLNVPLVDVHQAYLDEARTRGVLVDQFLLDGLHPNDAGHELVAKRLLPVIEQELARPK